MTYYEVLVRSSKYHGVDPLTYSSAQKLNRGQVVLVPLKQQNVLGIIDHTVSAPEFEAKSILEIYDLPPLPEANLALLEWLRLFYPAALGTVVQQFLPKALLKNPRKLKNAIPVEKDPKIQLPALTSEQKNVLQCINKPQSYLLHGETASGKTRIYLELAKKSLAAGQSVIILTPEITLTPQLVAFFQQHLNSPVYVYHSHLTDAQRRTVWQATLTSTEPVVVIGARSALFVPLKEVGLIGLDEAHETAYKQEQAPYYQTQRVASQLAQIHGATLVMGSATPSVADYYVALAKHVPILRMQKPATGEVDQPVELEVVDMKDRAQFTRSAYLSDMLLNHVEAAMHRNEQSLLFLNRRGTARIIVCQQCGWQALCPNCDLPLTYHGDAHQLRCHVCGYHAAAPTSCPVCSSTDIIFKGVGTKAIVDEVRRLLPKARVQRFDTDNLKAEQFYQHYEAVKAGEVDILVGTQTLAKGLDLPRLSVIGVVLADTGLYLPDYTANERTYQLLYQVLGRIGRGHTRGGQAIIQTYAPDNPTIQAALKREWPNFYDRELHERKQYRYPPFVFMLKLTCRRSQLERAQASAEKLASELRRAGLKLELVGPGPSFHERLGRLFQWQLVLKSTQRSELLKAITLLPSGWSYDLDPLDLL